MCNQMQKWGQVPAFSSRPWCNRCYYAYQACGVWLAGIPCHGLGQARVFIGEQVGLLSVPWLGPGDMQGLRGWRAVGW